MRKNLRHALVGGAVAIALVGSIAPLSVTSVAAAAAVPSEAATVTPTSGSSTTAFQLTLGANPSCPGDSATANYRWQTFLVPEGTDLDLLTFGSGGPVSPTGGFASPLYSSFGDAVVNQFTDQAVGADPVGRISGIPLFNLDVFTNDTLPAGRYAVGVACTLGPAGPTQVTNRWSTVLRVVGSASGPAWSTVEPVNNGPATLSVTSGDSATAFSLNLGVNPTCPGDSATGNYRWQTFMVPASTDLSTLAFTTAGPVAAVGQFRSPLFTLGGDPVANQFTDQAVGADPAGGISGIPATNLAVFDPGSIPGGEYKVGVACTLGVPGANQLKSYWSTTIRVVGLASGGGPARVAWSTAAGPENKGAATLTFTSGTADTPFRLRSFTLGLGANPSCPGDSATGNYRWQTFMVPASADLSGLTFTTAGPVAVTGQFRTPLYSVAGDPVANQFTDQAVGADPAGGITGVPTFRLDVFAPGDLPAGQYKVGVACTLGVPSLTQVTSYWSTTVSVAAEVALPGAPGTPVVTAGVGTLAVTVAPPTSGGTPASFTVTATGVSPATPDRTCTVAGASGSCTITGLSTSGRYRVSVVATNASGSSTPSPAWPAAPQTVTPGSGSSTPQFPDIAPTRTPELIRATSMLKLREISTAPQYFPASSVTRSQMAVFLWRMGGRADGPTSCGLRDMGAEGPQANQAVCWLLAQRITQVSGNYNPLGTVTRSQMALFMWRFAGEPGKDDPSKTGVCGVGDVGGEGPQARKAICWMKENNITAVTTNYFPNGVVDRGSMGLFLGRLGATLGLWVAPSVPS